MVSFLLWYQFLVFQKRRCHCDVSILGGRWSGRQVWELLCSCSVVNLSTDWRPAKTDHTRLIIWHPSTTIQIHFISSWDFQSHGLQTVWKIKNILQIQQLILDQDCHGPISIKRQEFCFDITTCVFCFHSLVRWGSGFLYDPWKKRIDFRQSKCCKCIQLFVRQKIFTYSRLIPGFYC